MSALENAAPEPKAPPESAPQGNEPPLLPGDTLAEKYRVESVIGRGGMGYVFAAEHLALGHRVALKVLRSSALENKEAIERFVREGRNVARLRSDHICGVSDVGTLPTGEPYLVMELLEGRDLAAFLKEKGALPVVEAVDYVLQTCEALAVAHVRGIIHRDLKPANLFLAQRMDGEPTIKVLDFGIAKSTGLGPEEEAITVTTALIGTPKYMSPEQLQDSRNVDQRADVWALGAILYEMLTGTRPFHAPTLALTCVRVLNDTPKNPSELRPDLPVELDEIIAHCLEKQLQKRWHDVGELAAALAPFGPLGSASAVARTQRILAAQELAKSGPRSMEATGSYAAASQLVRADGTRVAPAELRGTSSISNSGPLAADAISIVTPSSDSRSASGSVATPPPQPAAPRKWPLLAAGGVALLVVVAIIIGLRKGEQRPEDSRMPASSQAVSAGAPGTSRPVPSNPIPTATNAVATSAVPSATEAPKPTSGPTTAKTATKPTTTTTTKPSASTTAVAPPPSATATTKPTGAGDGVLDDRK